LARAHLSRIKHVIPKPANDNIPQGKVSGVRAPWDEPCRQCEAQTRDALAKTMLMMGIPPGKVPYEEATVAELYERLVRWRLSNRPAAATTPLLPCTEAARTSPRHELKHAPQWMLFPSQRGGEAVRALDWIGEGRAAETLTMLKQKLPPSTVEELVALRPALPTWMSKSIGQTLVTHG
jgi:hypothetical protein